MATLGELVKAAFSARPLGMPIPPNWIGLAAVGLLGFVDPAFWLVGAGLEVAYLAWLVHHPRFRALIAAERRAPAVAEQRARVEQLLAQLSSADVTAYRRMESRCREILGLQGDAGSGQADGLNRLLWIYLRLLDTRRGVSRLEDEGDRVGTLQERARGLERQLAAEGLGEDLRRSLQGQLDIVRQRLAKRDEAAGKLDFVEAELARIAEQVELIREQAMLAGGAEGVSARIDEVTATLGSTSDWIRAQQSVLGTVDDLAAPPLLASAPSAPRPARSTVKEQG